jgi:hypothetical protein
MPNTETHSPGDKPGEFTRRDVLSFIGKHRQYLYISEYVQFRSLANSAGPSTLSDIVTRIQEIVESKQNNNLFI